MRKLIVATMVLSLSCFAACGGGEDDGNGSDATAETGSPDAGDEETSDTATDETDTSENGGSDTSENGGDEDTTTNGEESIARFRYERHESGCASSCQRHVEVSLASRTIEKLENNSTRVEITEGFAEQLEENYLGDEALEKMKNGLDCGPDDPEQNTYNDRSHFFEAGIGTGPSSETERYVVSECIDPSSTSEDAKFAQGIADKLTDLRDHCFRDEEDDLDPCPWPE